MTTDRAARPPRLAVAVTLAIVAVVVGAPRVARAKLRVAVPEFKLDGEGTPALALQLQDGFVLGLVRAGVQVLDPIDVAKRLDGTPELKGCESSPCLKNLGRLLAVRYVLRVKIDVAGNGYKMVARLFSTEGDAPAALPLSTKSRTCDVCTVTEARDYMLRLADAVRPDLLDDPAPPVAPALKPPPPAPSLLPPLAAAMGGLVSMAAGIALYATLPDCHAAAATASTCSDNRVRSAVAGGLVGAGLVTTVVGTVVSITRFHSPSTASAPGATVTTVALTVPF
jgi:hypothetical protein